MDLIISKTTTEVLARIAKATAKKYGCDISIETDEFSGRLRTKFIGDKDMIKAIAEEVTEIFITKPDKNSQND